MVGLVARGGSFGDGAAGLWTIWGRKSVPLKIVGGNANFFGDVNASMACFYKNFHFFGIFSVPFWPRALSLV
jgi:hypothetical protein